jgi:hypothetical protein
VRGEGTVGGGVLERIGAAARVCGGVARARGWGDSTGQGCSSGGATLGGTLGGPWTGGKALALGTATGTAARGGALTGASTASRETPGTALASQR